MKKSIPQQHMLVEFLSLATALGAWDLAVNKINKNPHTWRAGILIRRSRPETIAIIRSKFHNTFASDKCKRGRKKNRVKGSRMERGRQARPYREDDI